MAFSSFNPLSALKRAQSEKGLVAPAGERELLELCALPVDAMLSRIGVNDKGLDAAAVESRRAQFGLNEAVKNKKLGFIDEILMRCKNPLVVQLLVIATVSYAMGDLRAATVVGLMIVLSVFL